MKMARPDLANLTMGVLIVMNSCQPGAHTFQLSYSLAVGSYFLGSAKRRR